MIPRALLAALAALVVVLGLHLFLLLAFTMTLLVVATLVFGIAQVVTETGWGTAPAGRSRA